MNKNKIAKKAYSLIFKENMTHQQAYEELKHGTSLNLTDLAEIVSKTPNKSMHAKILNLRTTYIVTMILIMVLRAFGVVVSITQDISYMVVFIALSFIVPGVGIYGAIKSNPRMYTGVGIILTISIIRGLLEGQIPQGVIEFLVYIPSLIGIILSFYIPTLFRVQYNKVKEQRVVDGKTVGVMVYKFEDVTPTISEDVLDV